MVQFLALGLEIPEDHPDRNKYFSMSLRKRQIEVLGRGGNHSDEPGRHSVPLYRRGL